ncbi:MAG: sulfatase-like hydrolase/transferase [Candidatus Marinimicrobia bacterium]|nr:sulfatase-like hydrolase/transferase [Candidatus Neomarinimicrobiota bacterium]
MKTRPNVIIIQWDELRADTLGYMGHPLVKTPNLDRLAAVSCNFSDHNAVAPMCAPSRQAFFTGKYGHCTNAVAGNLPLAPGQRYWPEWMAEHGYHTACIGKLHHTPTQDARGFQFARTNKNIDVLPTVLDLCGLPIPGDLQGKNLNRLIADEQCAWDETLYTEMHGVLRDASNTHPRLYEYRKGTREKEWKISFHAHRTDADPQWTFEWELYNYRADPGEQHNRAGDPACAAQLDRLKNELLLNTCRYEGALDFSRYGVGVED